MAALEDLQGRSGVRISVQGGWTIVHDPVEAAFWSFTPPGHPAHPAAVKRRAVERNGHTFIDMRVLCQADKASCDKLVAEFKELNEKIAAGVQRRSQTETRQWSPSERQKASAADTLARFLRTMDAGRHEEAYEMLTPGLKAMLSLDQFVSVEQKVRQQAGGEPSRSDTRTTWYKDPPHAAAPGVYAAFNISCSFRNANLCEEVVILHEQSDGTFLVMRHERNFIDKESERKLREAEQKRPGA